jgi:hypothetical protein
VRYWILANVTCCNAFTSELIHVVFLPVARSLVASTPTWAGWRRFADDPHTKSTECDCILGRASMGPLEFDSMEALAASCEGRLKEPVSAPGHPVPLRQEALKS